MNLRNATLLCAGIAGATGVLIGAYVAHGLDAYLVDAGIESPLLERRIDQADVGVRYHLIHAVALLALAAMIETLPRRRRIATLLLIVAGIFLFSGSLYLLVLLDQPWLGAVTPLGGLSWIAAWCTIASLAFARPA